MINYTLNIPSFDSLKNELPVFKVIATKSGINGFFGQEVLRFYSIAGTILSTFDTSKEVDINQRYITHILIRSLLENYFWILYLFDKEDEKNNRYSQLINSFKRDYAKLMNEELLTCKEKLEQPDAEWSQILKGLDVRSMLTQVKNDFDDNLGYLYFAYRITSFDTHGKNLKNITDETFDKDVQFPVLDISRVCALIATEYLDLLKKLRELKEV